MDISICICTRKRMEGLKRLLKSFEKMHVPPDVDVRIIIVENDEENYSESIVREFSDRSKFSVSYYLEPKQGLVIARNRSVAEAGDCDFCCFTDDDQVVSLNWLTELLKCQREFDADGVAGPTLPSFTKEVQVYIRSFHQPSTYPYGTIVKHAFTGCLILRKKYLDMLNGPFETRLNLSGGEDSYLTKQITKLGGTIRFNPEALAYEIIPENRATIKYIIKRKFRTSNTELLIRSISDKDFRKITALPRLIMRFCYGLLILIPFLIFGKADKLRGLIKIVNAIGGFAGIFGRQSQFYR